MKFCLPVCHPVAMPFATEQRAADVLEPQLAATSCIWYATKYLISIHTYMGGKGLGDKAIINYTTVPGIGTSCIPAG